MHSSTKLDRREKIKVHKFDEQQEFNIHISTFIGRNNLQRPNINEYEPSTRHETDLKLRLEMIFN